jgi:hypothetical protein
MDEKKGLYIDSEIGRLEKVLIHSPGREIEAMTPERAEKVLYNDIIPLSVVSAEHRKLKAFLSLVSRVYEVGDLLREIAPFPSIGGRSSSSSRAREASPGGGAFSPSRRRTFSQFSLRPEVEAQYT